MNVVADLLAERTGLWFGAHNIDLLERGLGQLGAALGLPLDVLCERLRTDDPKSALWHKLVEVVTVGETYLFRHPEQLTLLGQRLVPERLAKGQRLLRAWSAGCATGEEAYSLAMVLHRAAPSCELSVLGTDISTQALAVAARARGSERRMLTLVTRPPSSSCDATRHRHQHSRPRLPTMVKH